jgi:GNAT superfamily N-acetyltransferase
MSAATPLPDGLFEVGPGKLACIVTSLEMLEQPPLRAAPAPSAFALRRIEDPRPDWYRALFRRVGEPWLWFSRLLLEDAALTALIADPAVEVFAVDYEGSDAGLLELDFRAPGTCELAFFGLAPELTGRGAGRWLMEQALRRAWSRPIDRLWVHTCTLDHPAALPFYMRSGFRPFRQQVEIADDPRLLGVLPREAAPQVPLR